VASLNELHEELTSVFLTRRDKTIFVKADGKVPYGKVVEAMDVAHGAGAERVGIIREKTIHDGGRHTEGPSR
jgi:biopolymer transport protein ExbD